MPDPTPGVHKSTRRSRRAMPNYSPPTGQQDSLGYSYMVSGSGGGGGPKALPRKLSWHGQGGWVKQGRNRK